jgi:hypothetical protein
VRYGFSLIFYPFFSGQSINVVSSKLSEAFLWKRKRYQRNRFPALKEWCPEHLWAPGCYHGSGGQGWAVMEKYISGQKGYDEREAVRGAGVKPGVMPVVVRSEEKAKTHKTWCMTLYEKLFEV